MVGRTAAVLELRLELGVGPSREDEVEFFEGVAALSFVGGVTAVGGLDVTTRGVG